MRRIRQSGRVMADLSSKCLNIQLRNVACLKMKIVTEWLKFKNVSSLRKELMVENKAVFLTLLNFESPDWADLVQILQQCSS